MPFKSKRQMNYLFKVHPDLAHKWASEYGAPKKKGRKEAIERRVKRAAQAKSTNPKN